MRSINSMSDRACCVCHSPSANVFIELLNLPVYCNLLWSDAQQAKDCPKGDIRLAYCDRCGAITNVAFDPTRLGYSQEYENSLHYSPRFQAYADELAQRLVTKHQLYDKKIIEIGCGKGDFLVSLCQLGNNSGIGFDNSYIEREEHSEWGDRIQFIQDFYSERYAHYQGDLICCRQVLEHIQQPADLLGPLRKTINPSTTLFFEVPNALYTFRNMMIWDIIYEHCTYFTATSLSYAFAANGYQTSEVQDEFGGQFISIEAQPVLEPVSPSIGLEADLGVDLRAIADLTTDIAQFKDRFQLQKQQWQVRFDALFAEGKKVVIWGAGSKGVTFLNLLTMQDRIEYAVDINPRKQNKFIPGTGQKIVSPEAMLHYSPDVVIVMNPLYQQEVKSALQAMGLTPQVVTTDSDSNR